MNSNSKLTLSDEELQLVNNSSWILTKRIIIDKVCQLFGSLADSIKGSMEKEESWLPPEALQSSPKISKGENYLQLPYVLLDYPRCFDADHVFAVRTMFWWGNFFSMTLHLSGRYKKMFAAHICSNREILLQNDFYVCTNEDQWQHHFEENNYGAVRQLSKDELEQLIGQKPFLKLAVKFTLHQWKEADDSLERSFADIMKLVKA
jgi:hypothetical protein